MRLVKDASIEDLAYIGSWLCDEDRRELAATRDPDDYVSLANDAHDSTICKVVLDEIEPVFAFGAKIDGSSSIVWGFKTERGWKSIGTVTKFIVRDMIPALRARGVRHGLCLVHETNVRSCKWLAHLGYRPKATVSGLGTHGEDTLILYGYDDLEPHERRAR